MIAQTMMFELAPPIPAVAPPVAMNADVAHLLSPSQVNCFLGCNAKWKYKHLLKLPDVRGASLALGSAVHVALGANFAQKVETREDLPVAGVIASFLTAWAEEKDKTTFAADDDVQELEDTGKMGVAMYMDQVAPRIEPAAVELKCAGAIAGVNVQGRIDVLDVNGRIIDVKTAARKPVGNRPDHRFQIATYKAIEPRATGGARLDTIVKTKTMGLYEHSFDVEASDVKAVEVLYPLAQEAMRAGLYTPNRNSFLCSRKYCAWWERCEDEYGGKVGAK